MIPVFQIACQTLSVPKTAFETLVAVDTCCRVKPGYGTRWEVGAFAVNVRERRHLFVSPGREDRSPPPRMPEATLLFASIPPARPTKTQDTAREEFNSHEEVLASVAPWSC